MSFIQNFFTSRDNNANAATYVGQQDRLWWNPNTNALYVSDGNTAGGIPVSIGPGANANLNLLTVNTIGTDDSSVLQFITDVNFNEFVSVEQDLTVSGNIVVAGNISAATDTKIGGVRAGPGANISNTGLLTIDTAGLPLSFGNFTANNNILTIVNSDEDMILETSGNAEIQLVGNVGFYKPNGGGVPDPSALFFFARDDGQLRIFVPVEDPLEGGVEIVGSATGNYVTPGAPGTMLQLTGNPDLPCRLYHDSLREYSSYVARRYNGTTASPGQVLAGQDVFRINTTAATNAGMGNVAMAQVRFTALEDQTTTAQGSEISFYVTAIGQPAANRVEVATITVANGITATKFTTAGTVTATGNITGGNVAGTLITGTLSTAAQPNVTSVGTLTSLTVTGNVSGGNLITGGLLSVTGNITGGNVLTGGIVSATGNITGGNVSATNLTGTLTTASQTNITAVGTLASLTVTANVSGGNILTGGLISATGGITSGDGITDSKGDVRSIPVNTQNTSYTLVASDAGKLINMTTGNVTVPASVFTTPFGQAITIYNDQNSSNAIVQGSGVTIRLAGTAATGNRTLARYGLATLVCVSANTFVISGAGLT